MSKRIAVSGAAGNDHRLVQQSGEALGASGRMLWFLAGQTLFFLYLSGLFR
jgi:hypothetical protein